MPSFRYFTVMLSFRYFKPISLTPAPSPRHPNGYPPTCPTHPPATHPLVQPTYPLTTPLPTFLHFVFGPCSIEPYEGISSGFQVVAPGTLPASACTHPLPTTPLPSAPPHSTPFPPAASSPARAAAASSRCWRPGCTSSHLRPHPPAPNPPTLLGHSPPPLQHRALRGQQQRVPSGGARAAGGVEAGHGGAGPQGQLAAAQRGGVAVVREDAHGLVQGGQRAMLSSSFRRGSWLLRGVEEWLW